jgi:hypothetical protein
MMSRPLRLYLAFTAGAVFAALVIVLVQVGKHLF